MLSRFTIKYYFIFYSSLYFVQAACYWYNLVQILYIFLQIIKYKNSFYKTMCLGKPKFNQLTKYSDTVYVYILSFSCDKTFINLKNFRIQHNIKDSQMSTAYEFSYFICFTSELLVIFLFLNFLILWWFHKPL